MTKMYPRDNNHNPVIVTGFGGKDGQRRELTYFSLSDCCF